MARKKDSPSVKGTLVMIGGSEDRSGKMRILAEVAHRIQGKLCIATVASTLGAELWEEYREVFKRLGVKTISHLDMVQRHGAGDAADWKAIRGAEGVFFSGGDQLRITNELGGTKIADEIYRIYARGGVIAGTSAGASIMGETMMVAGRPGSFRIGGDLHMASGLGFVKNMIVDQHFAERGRITRLLAAVAHNPKFLGIGIDENTAVILEKGQSFQAIGQGAVYVLDAHDSSDCNLSEENVEGALSIFNVKFHVLSDGDRFDLKTRRPLKKRS